MRPVPRTAILRLRALACAACALPAFAGCVRREIEITSTPPGALLTLNGREVGRTPQRIQFTFDGTYDVRLRLAGYESVQGSGTTDMPVWDFIGADLVAEVAPVDAHRLEHWHFELVPDDDANATIRDRAEAARRAVQAMPERVEDAPPPAPTATPEGGARRKP
jgi:hypothetical protein